MFFRRFDVLQFFRFRNKNAVQIKNYEGFKQELQNSFNEVFDVKYVVEKNFFMMNDKLTGIYVSFNIENVKTLRFFFKGYEVHLKKRLNFAGKIKDV